MRNLRNALFVLLALAGIALVAHSDGIEVLGIEVLGIEVLQDGTTIVDTLSTMAPVGSHVHAVQYHNGHGFVVDMAPVDPVSGLATVSFPVHREGNEVALVSPEGIVLAVEPANLFEHD